MLRTPNGWLRPTVSWGHLRRRAQAGHAGGRPHLGGGRPRTPPRRDHRAHRRPRPARGWLVLVGAYDRPTAATTLRYRWTQEDFLVAEAAGAFKGRGELVDGEVWPVPIGRWHGRATARCIQLLAADGVVTTTESLATSDSLPDPDVWVCPSDAEESGRLPPRISLWDASDVLLVVEVSDETVAEDLDIKARLYGAAGYVVYWVVTRDTVFEHTGPGAEGYRTVVRYRRGEEIPLPCADRTITVADLVGEINA